MDGKECRSSEISTEAAEHLSRCYGAVLFATMEDDFTSYRNAFEQLEEFGAELPEKYLDFISLDKSREVFKNSANWLNEMMTPQRFYLFRKISTFFSLRYLRQVEDEVPGCLVDNVSKIRYVSDNLGISLDDATKIFIDEYANARAPEAFIKAKEEVVGEHNSQC